MLKKCVMEMMRMLVKKIFSIFPLSKTILFESNPNYACNTYPVFLYLKEILPQYKMVWIVDKGCRKIRGVDDITYINPVKLEDRIKSSYYIRRSSAIISCNRIIPKGDERQLSLFLCHGSKTKRTKGSYEMGERVDYINVQSHFFDDVITYEYSCEKSQLVYLGYPRCDCFFEKVKLDVRRKFFNNEKYMIWLPTYRKYKYGRLDDINTFYDNLGMPLIYSLDELKTFNLFLKQKKIHIVYKPHPVQDVSAITNEVLSNIHIISDSDLERENLLLYEVLAQSEALITDYSSVFFDYLLLDRPIATTTDDIESWKNARGFAFDLEALYDKATVRVPDVETLEQFIVDVLSGEDKKKEERKEICSLTNMYQDGNATQRVAAFVKEKIGVNVQ